MIDLTILGNYGPYATAKSACSGYLINADGFQIMLDCGNGAFSKFQKYGDLSKLNILMITHMHEDHYSDIFCLRHAIRYQMKEGIRKDPVFLYLPEGPEEIMEKIKSWDEEFVVINLEEAVQIVNDFNRFQLEFFPVQHEMPAYGVHFEVDGNRLLTYTGDTGWYPELQNLCANTKFLLTEASLQEYEVAERGNTHMSARQAGRLAQNCGAENLILTHFFPEHNLHQLQREAESVYDGKTYMSSCGKQYILQD